MHPPCEGDSHKKAPHENGSVKTCPAMATRASKRQKTNPSPAKPGTKTLLHFFSKPTPNGPTACDIIPQRMESEPEGLHDQLRRKSGVALYNDLSAGSKAGPVAPNESPLRARSETMELVPAFTEHQETCVPTTEDRINPFDCFDLPDEIEDENYRDEDFGEDELNFPYEEFDETFDDIEVDYETVTMRVKPESVPDATVDEGPSCPFCSFSFRGLSENVPFCGDVTDFSN